VRGFGSPTPESLAYDAELKSFRGHPSALIDRRSILYMLHTLKLTITDCTERFMSLQEKCNVLYNVSLINKVGKGDCWRQSYIMLLYHHIFSGTPGFKPPTVEFCEKVLESTAVQPENLSFFGEYSKGLREVRLETLGGSVRVLESLLISHGPIYCNVSGHVILIAGITKSGKIVCHDPLGPYSKEARGFHERASSFPRSADEIRSVLAEPPPPAGLSSPIRALRIMEQESHQDLKLRPIQNLFSAYRIYPFQIFDEFVLKTQQPLAIIQIWVPDLENEQSPYLDLRSKYGTPEQPLSHQEHLLFSSMMGARKFQVEELKQQKAHLLRESSRNRTIQWLREAENRRIAVNGIWEPGTEHRTCIQCGVSFGMITRRHHCRGCGKVLCGTCAPKRNIEPGARIRICTECMKRSGLARSVVF